MKVALLISTYNRADALELCLKSVVNQVVLPDEILVADDGSTSETRDIVNYYKEKFFLNIKHIWQEDQGFQLAMIRNKAIAISTTDYIIQIDGDLILDRYFVKNHKEFCKPNSFVRSSRIYLDEDLTNDRLSNKSIEINRFDKRVSNFFSAFRIPFLRLFFENKYKIKGDELWEIHGCNMAYWRKDAIKVNGYNEDFFGWGPEDKEFVARLINSGVKKRFLKFGAIVFHLWHKINEKDHISKNELIFENTKKLELKFCVNGMDKYLN